jgi:hypothetical protein
VSELLKRFLRQQMSAGEDLGPVDGARPQNREALYSGMLFAAGRWQLGRACTLHTGQAGRPAYTAPPPEPMGGAAGRAGVVCACGGPGSLQASCRNRGHPLVGGTDVWATPYQVSGVPENALATYRHHGRNQCRADCCLAGGAPARHHTHVTLCVVGPCGHTPRERRVFVDVEKI